jgi:hypothetical protein
LVLVLCFIGRFGPWKQVWKVGKQSPSNFSFVHNWSLGSLIPKYNRTLDIKSNPNTKTNPAHTPSWPNIKPGPLISKMVKRSTPAQNRQHCSSLTSIPLSHKTRWFCATSPLHLLTPAHILLPATSQTYPTPPLMLFPRLFHPYFTPLPCFPLLDPKASPNYLNCPLATST